MISVPTVFLDDVLHVVTLIEKSDDPVVLTTAGVGSSGVRKAVVDTVKRYVEAEEPFLTEEFFSTKIENWSQILEDQEREIADAVEYGEADDDLPAYAFAEHATSQVEDAIRMQRCIRWVRDAVLDRDDLDLNAVVGDRGVLPLLEDHPELEPTVFHVLLAFLDGLGDYTLSITTPTIRH